MCKFEVFQDTGYGLIPKRIMRDPNLTSQAKAIYSYLASFAGNTGKSFPSTSLMAKEMNMSKNTLFKYLKELKEKGAITVKREKTNDGMFGKNIYYLHNSMGEAPCTKKPDMDNPDMDKPDMANEDTISNSIKSNSIKSNRESTSGTLSQKDKELIIEKWNSLGLHQLRTINSNTDRCKSLKARIEEYSLKEFLEAIEKIKESDFLQGKVKDWQITFDWLCRPNNFPKVLEGQYSNTGGGQNGGVRESFVEDEEASIHDKISKLRKGSL